MTNAPAIQVYADLVAQQNDLADILTALACIGEVAATRIRSFDNADDVDELADLMSEARQVGDFVMGEKRLRPLKYLPRWCALAARGSDLGDERGDFWPRVSALLDRYADAVPS